MLSDPPDPAADATGIERADVAVTRAAAPARHHGAVKLLGKLSELADQPQLIAICSATLALGLLTGNRTLARAGGRMLAAELVATGMKSIVKANVDRTRPKLLVDENRYEMKPGKSEDGPMSSFPSGHTAGALAVARALARTYHEHAVAAYGTAAVVAAIQVPRCAHYPSDLAAGAAIGVAAEALSERLLAAGEALVARRDD